MTNKLDKNEIMIVDERSIRDKIYKVRGMQIMLDFELAEIYGYSTTAFNQQVKNNIDKFEGEDFCFYLTADEFKDLRNLISKNLTSSWGGRRKPPRAFTESGVYMLMTVLRGELATKQSRALIRTFRAMKDYIIENQQLMITQKDYVTLTTKVDESISDIKNIKEKLADTVTYADLSDFMKLFDSGIEHDEILILDGQPFKADLAYQKIYRRAKSSIIVIDDYINTKTLHHLTHARQSVKITIISDNKARPKLKASEYEDFKAEYPKREIHFIKAEGKVHDRYIILDYGTKDMKVYHCGASSKDAGKRITTISEMKEVESYKEMTKNLLSHSELVLK